MSADPLVSVIVPIYNVEDYLEECVRSIIAQSYRKLEIVLVDDGSEDRSGLICDELAAIDDRVVAYHKENGGLSDARNYGLAKSHGEWISFIDSDDYISPVFIEALLRAAINAGCDISAIPFGKPFSDADRCELLTSLPTIPIETLDSHSTQRLMLYQALDTGAPWRLYRKILLDDNPFPKGLYYEDLATVYKIIRKVDKVALLDCCELYAYRMRSNSIIRQEYRHIKAESALKISNQLFSDICEWYPDLSQAAASRCFSLCRMVFAQVPAGASATVEARQDRNELWSVLRLHRGTVLKDSRARKRERLAATFACLGERAFAGFCFVARRVGLMR